MNQEQEHTRSANGVQRTALVRLLRSWYELTTDEQKAILTVLALFLIGLAVRVWHLNT